MRDGPQIGEWVRSSGSEGLDCRRSPPLVELLQAENLEAVVGVRFAVLMHRQRYPRTINKR